MTQLTIEIPDDLARFRQLDVVANAQPLWALHEGQMDILTIPFIGERWRRQYPFRNGEGRGGDEGGLAQLHADDPRPCRLHARFR